MSSAFVVVVALAAAMASPSRGTTPVSAADTARAPVQALDAIVRLVARARTPSFARQMKLSCSTCHFGGFPQLTRFGRLFKLNGYSLSGLPRIVEQLDSTARRTLSLSPIPGLSMGVVIDATRIATPVPGTMRTVSEYPQQVSLFYGGEIAPKLGALAQLTYDGADGRLRLDNTDIRYATHTSLAHTDLLVGLTLHNNPTVQDVWNTSAAWSYPFVSPASTPRPAAAPLLDGRLAQSVLGLGAYALLDNLVYAEVSGYASTPPSGVAADTTSSNVLHQVAPYWRLALQNRQGPVFLMLGTFGIDATLAPIGATGASTRYRDIGIDAQAERELGQGSLVVRASWTHEQRTTTSASGGASVPLDRSTHSLQSVRANVVYAPVRFASLTVGAFDISGSTDAALYAPGAVVGSRTGSPDSRGASGELALNPWLNVRVGLQYIRYATFNGARHSYDLVTGGRNAQDNNTFMLYTWFAF